MFAVEWINTRPESTNKHCPTSKKCTHGVIEQADGDPGNKITVDLIDDLPTIVSAANQ